MHLTIVRERQPLSIHVAWLFIVMFLFLFYRFMPPSRCLFHDITGFPCLSCGATRAAGAFLAGDLFNMIYFNPLLVLFCGGLIFYSLFKLSEFIFNFNVKVHFDRKIAQAMRITSVCLIILNWVFLIATER